MSRDSEIKQKIESANQQGECLRCGHLACPGCKNWCDSYVDEHGQPDSDGELCCNGECVYKKEKKNTKPTSIGRA